MSDLSFQQRNFINEYFEDFNGTRAAGRAGYKGDENTLAATASRLLRKDKIKKRIESRFRASCMSADEALMRLAMQARGDVGDYIDEHGVIDWKAIKENGTLFKEIIHLSGQRSSFKMHDAQAALNTILKHHGALVDKTQNTTVDLGSLTTEQLERLAQGEDMIHVLATTRQG